MTLVGAVWPGEVVFTLLALPLLMLDPVMVAQLLLAVELTRTLGTRELHHGGLEPGDGEKGQCLILVMDLTPKMMILIKSPWMMMTVNRNLWRLGGSLCCMGDPLRVLGLLSFSTTMSSSVFSFLEGS